MLLEVNSVHMQVISSSNDFKDIECHSQSLHSNLLPLTCAIVWLEEYMTLIHCLCLE